VPFAPKEMDDVGWTDPLKMAGIGGWEVTEWVTDVRSVYKKHPRHSEFRPGEPHFDELKSIAIPDAVASQSSFISGQTMTIEVAQPEVLQSIRKGRPDANLYTYVKANWQHMRPHSQFGPFKDYRVRRAIHLAIDYKGQNEAEYGAEGGWAYQAALNPGFPEAWSPEKVQSLPGYNPDTKPADIAEGQKLLAAAGYPNGKGIEYDIIYSGSTNDQALRFEDFMERAYTEMKVVQKPLGGGATFANRQAEGDFQMLSYSITCAPDAVIEMISQFRTEGSRNYGRFSNADSDRILDKAIVELNKDARTKMLDEYQQRWFDEWLPIYPWHADAVKTMVQGNVGGYDAIVGPWFGYSQRTKISRLFFVDK
jgi:ABC-type transport system substrate-binding protein